MVEKTDEDLLAHFRAQTEKNGMATGPVKDGRVFMFKTDYLRRLILSTNTSMLKFGIRQANGSIKDVELSKDRLQMELDRTTKSYIFIFLTDGPVKN